MNHYKFFHILISRKNYPFINWKVADSRLESKFVSSPSTIVADTVNARNTRVELTDHSWASGAIV